MIRKLVFIATMLVAGLLASTGLQCMTGSAHADPCIGSWSLGVPGLGNDNASDFWGKVNDPVEYTTNSPETGLWAIDAAFWSHRDQCPGDHIKIVGHSEGAGLVHVWGSEHGWVDNVSLVLLADPKRGWDQPGGPGMSDVAYAWWVQPFYPWFPGFLTWPLAGVDDNLPLPTLSVCSHEDWVCNTEAIPGYSHITGLHGWAYDFNAGRYPDDGNGPVFF